jgi:hypothetical protein
MEVDKVLKSTFAEKPGAPPTALVMKTTSIEVVEPFKVGGMVTPVNLPN